MNTVNTDIIRNDFECAGTYKIQFDDYKDETEFYAEDADELIDLWLDFCGENDIDADSFCGIEFVSWCEI